MRAERFPRSVFAVGDEPDPRFTLANERTFLAWIRTGLALLGGGVALEALELPLAPTAQWVASMALVSGGLVISLRAWFGWISVERSLRRGDPLPTALSSVLVSVLVVVAAVAILLGLILG